MLLNTNISSLVLGGGGLYLILSLTLFFNYVILRNFILYIRSRYSKKKARLYMQLILNTLLVAGFFYLGALILGFVIDLINLSSSHDEVLSMSLKFISFERDVFGGNVSLWFHDSRNVYKSFWDSMSSVLIVTYDSLGIVIAISALIFILNSSKITYRLSVSWILATLISLPIWYFFPAISPQEFFIDNSLSIVLPSHLTGLLEYFDPSPLVQESIRYYDAYWNSGLNNRFAITTFPSMHVAWTTILMVYLSKINRYSLVFFVPYWVLTCISTVYLMQHYVIDVPAGIVVAFISIVIASLIKETPSAIENVCAFSRRDMLRAYSFCENKVRLMLNGTVFKLPFFRY